MEHGIIEGRAVFFSRYCVESHFSASFVFENYTHVDGSPCGVKL